MLLPRALMFTELMRRRWNRKFQYIITQSCHSVAYREREEIFTHSIVFTKIYDTKKLIYCVDYRKRAPIMAIYLYRRLISRLMPTSGAKCWPRMISIRWLKLKRFTSIVSRIFTFLYKILTSGSVDIPRDGQPIILGKKANFRPNELVNLTCTAPMSNPAAQLAVTLNGNGITSNSNYYQRVYHNRYDNGLTSTSMNVQFPSYWLQTKRTNMFECVTTIVHHSNRSASVRVEARTDAENRTAFYLHEQATLHGPSFIKRESACKYRLWLVNRKKLTLLNPRWSTSATDRKLSKEIWDRRSNQSSLHLSSTQANATAVLAAGGRTGRCSILGSQAKWLCNQWFREARS